ncbi:hypothetical protein FJZ20_01500 [Candidatus Pacearchaeota archaeon]|nr:hypothetical protein [Candidatus Pacearchaeota archaeon]
MELKATHWIGMVISLAILGVSLLLMDTRYFFFVFGMGVTIGATPFVISIVNETRIENEKEEMFLEFARSLVESVKTGTPVNKAIINVKNKSYGVLGNYIKKLANQISMGIPLNKALYVFSKDVNNKTISRALTLIGEAERSGGDIGNILESVTAAVGMVDNLKKERKAAISSLIVQGYIIFFVFIVIILVLQFQILPSLSGISGIEEGFSSGLGGSGMMGSIGVGGGAPIEEEEIASSFVYLLLVQGLFSGLVIGELSERSIKAGIRHSFILMLVAFLISAGATLIFGG